MFDLHNSIQPKQTFSPTNLTGCLPPRVNPDAARLRPPPHTAAPLHPPIAPLHWNQESPHMLLSPFKTGVAPSSLPSEIEALNKSTHHRLLLLHGTITPPSSAL
jgi:hypothetical protein